MPRQVRIPSHYLKYRVSVPVDGHCYIWGDGHDNTGRAYSAPTHDPCPPDGHYVYAKTVLRAINQARSSVPYRGSHRMAAVTVEQADDERHWPFQFWRVTPVLSHEETRRLNAIVQMPDGTRYRHITTVTPHQAGERVVYGYYATRAAALEMMRALADGQEPNEDQMLACVYPSGSWSVHRGLDIITLGTQEEG